MKSILPITALLLSACVPNQQALKQKQDESIDNYLSCLHKYVPDVDDMRSDAYSVAIALSTKCHNEFQASIDAYMADANNATRRQFEQRMQGRNEKHALVVVMEYRKLIRDSIH